MHTILITGKNGQVGWELVRTLAPLGRIIAIDVDEVDFTKPETIRSFIRDIPELNLIVNPAAYTNVDGAEDAPGLARQINGDAPAVLAEEAKKRGIPMIHYSTDYIFDGTKTEPYTETDEANPLSVYGQTKWEGEQAVRSILPQHLILRLCWVYGARGKNFLLTMLRLAKQGTVPKVVCDQFGAPTWCRMIAEATALMAHSILRQPTNNIWGTYHLAASGSTSWHGFATEIYRSANERFGWKNGVPIAIPSTDYPTPAKRPQYSLLSAAKIAETFGIILPVWQEQLKTTLAGSLPSDL